MEKGIGTIVKKYFVGIILLVFFSLFVTDFFFVPAENTTPRTGKTCVSNQISEKTLKISDIVGPRIDDKAVSISCVQSQSANNGKTLPGKIWVLLLIAYISLLVFALTYDFKTNTQVHWVWELILTGIIIVGWYYFDEQTLKLWFPLYVVKTGAIVYVSYLYFFERKQLKTKCEDVI